MKTIRALLFGLMSLCVPIGLFAQNIWLNELHYDNVGTDQGEFLEVILENPGNYNLADFSIVLYNGNGGIVYNTLTLDGFTAGSTIGNFKIFWDTTVIQNGAPDGLAIVYQGTVVAGQFLSYEGTLTATDGPAAGMTSVDIGVAESTTTPVGYSLQLAGTGGNYASFAWQPESPATRGLINTGQNLGGSPDPEPTNYPTGFTAGTSPFTINLSWVDATGAQLPSAYLVLGSDQNNIANPADGTPVPDDANLADGKGALNISQGTQSCSFGNLPANKQYYFKIFPYTNTGTNINYKTDGTPPSVTATTSNTVIIDSIHFSNYTFANWIAKNVTGAQVWAVDSIHGVNGGPCAKMSGYAGASNVNEDWFITPAMNFNKYTNEALNFKSAYKYAGPALECLISNDYDGVSNPGDFSWTPLTATWSPGNWAWTPSGNINVSGTNGDKVYIGFKYTSTATESATWELDDIVITGDLIIGMEETAERASFTVRPNPVSDQCRIDFSAPGAKDIEIISVAGQRLFHSQTVQDSYSMNISGLSSGVYILRVTWPGIQISGIQKLIVK